MQTGAKIIVKGLVQGVGYRYFCYKKAMEYGIKGYAKNLFNDDVELEVVGGENMIAEFTRDIKIGPANAHVKSIDIEILKCENKYSDFKIY